MKTLRVTLRVVFYLEDGRWLARCLEFDLLGDGETKQAALGSLFEAIRLQVDESLRSGNVRNLFSPADGGYFEMYAAGRDIDEIDLRIEPDSLSNETVVIERAEAREYRDADLLTV